MSYPYTPPAGGAVNFSFSQTGYAPPAASTVAFIFSRSAITALAMLKIIGHASLGGSGVNQYSMLLIF
jgi:hypothetical protein